jgi:hypothetical protein
LVIGYERLLAYRELALSKYAPLDALIDEKEICYIVEDVLQMSAKEPQVGKHVCVLQKMCAYFCGKFDACRNTASLVRRRRTLM